MDPRIWVQVCIFPNDRVFENIGAKHGYDVWAIRYDVIEWCNTWAGTQRSTYPEVMLDGGWFVVEDRLMCQALFVFADPDISMRFKLTWL